MDDLISRRAALAAIDKNRDALLSSGMAGAEHILVHYGRRVIEELPSVEPKRGKWIAVFIEYADGSTGQRAECPFCKEQQLTWTNYCPNCGAKMERSEE